MAVIEASIIKTFLNIYNQKQLIMRLQDNFATDFKKCFFFVFKKRLILVSFNHSSKTEKTYTEKNKL